jgi:RES domain-containing protein
MTPESGRLTVSTRATPSVSPMVARLRERLAELFDSAGVFEGTVYRSVVPKYATEHDVLTGEGARQHGGRWNPPGVAVVYASLTPETAMAEALAQYRYFGLPLHAAMPRMFLAIEARLRTVLDLTAGEVRRRLRVSADAMTNIDWRKQVAAGVEPITRRLGEAASGTGLEGLLVPSAAERNGVNLLVFPGNLTRESSLNVANPDKLA